MKTEIIKLREAEASSKASNADFNVTLDRPIKMKKGDALNISKVFLDTITAGGSLIELNEDVPVEMDVCRYILNDQADQLFPAPNNGTRMRDYQPAPGGSVDTEGDGALYFMGKTLNTPANTQKAIEIKYNVKTRTNRMVGGLTLKYQYVNLDGSIGHANFRIKREKGTFYSKEGKSFDIGIKMVGESMQLLNTTDELKNHWINPDSVKVNYKAGGVPAGQATAQLITKSFTMTVEAGVYTPQQLGVLITDKMTQIDYSGAIGDDLANGIFPINSPFLGTICQERRALDPTGANNNLIFVKSDGTGCFRYTRSQPGGLMVTTNNDRFVGANEVALTFDENHKKMSFPIMHFSNYVNESAANNDAVPGLLYEPYGISNKYSGVAFTHLGPPDFWQNLGFENITVGVEQLDTEIPLTGANPAFQPYKVIFEEGQQVTGGFKSLDTPVQKNVNFRKPITTAGTKVQSADTIAILGDKIFSNSYENEGYYLIELGMTGVRQSLTGAHGDIGFNSNKIFGIVGTYYQSNSFTSDDTSGIPYIHDGDDELLLSDISVRVLNANGSVPTDDLIGEHNTIFLEVQSSDQVNKK